MRGGKADIQERGASIASVADDPSFATGHTKCMKKPLEIVLSKSQQNAPFWTPNLAYGKQTVFDNGCGTLPVAKGRGISMKRAVLYLRVSTTEQTTANQERELREIAARMGCEAVRVYRDHGISGAKGRDGRPEFDRLCRDAAKRQFDLVMAWSVDRLGRSLQDLVGFLSELHALKIDLFLHQQGLDTMTPAGK